MRPWEHSSPTPQAQVAWLPTARNRNSPYTTALLQTLDTPGLSIETVFKRVAASVFTATNRQQTPWYSSSLFQGDFIFNNK